MRALLALPFLLAATMALAHSWYPVECCSGHDCDAIQASRVQALGAGGYMVDGAHYVPAAQVRQSPDGEYHACFPSKDKLRCFWAPPPST